MKKQKKTGSVLVVGGGVGGIQAALDLAESGYYVYMVEKSSAIGGAMAQLDKTFPTNDCSLCILSPKLVECGRHLNIEILTLTEVTEVKEENGNYRVSLLQRPRYIDPNKCTACGNCAEKCPTKVPDEYNEGLGYRKAIHIKYAQAVPLAYVIDAEHCKYLTEGKCGLCATKFCKTGAIDFSQKPETKEITVGSIILAPGFDEFDPSPFYNYGYKRFKNVVTSIEFERILNASGPYKGEVLRPSDREHPKKVAFIQCVGSRDTAHPYCSSVCCTYAIKESVVAKEHNPDLDISIFFMDMRTQGKGFDAYYERAKTIHHIRFVRSKITDIKEDEATENLVLAYEAEDGKIRHEPFDMVVLSVGLEAAKTARELSRTFGIGLNEFNFCRTDRLQPLKTTKPGIFVAGAFQGPKDIPETVAQASAAVSESSCILADSRWTRTAKKEYPPERDVKGREPRIGVFVCHCGINIGGVVDVPDVKEYAKGLPHVCYAEENLYTCSQDTQERIKEKIREHDLNRVVVTACSPRTHEPLFQETLREAGLNRYLFEMANIRDHCSWVHMHEKEKATRKAKDLLKMAVSKAALLEPLEEITVDVINRALIIGGGLAGMTAALQLAKQGFECHLIEKEKALGGHMRKIYFMLDGKAPQAYLKRMIREVEENKLIHCHKNSQVVHTEGYIGNFKSSIRTGNPSAPEDLQIEHGIVIVATGAKEYEPKEYLYGRDERIMTQSQLEKRISEFRDPNAPVDLSGDACRSVVMIQCVASRCEELPYCSKVCCSQAIKNALRLKEINPDCEVYILYRDVRSYGLNEIYYREAREKGVIFIRYDEDKKPAIRINDSNSKPGDICLKVYDEVLGRDILIRADLLVLSVPVIPNENEALAKTLKVPLTSDGFFLEAHVKLRPVDFATEGVFLCGLAHSPKPVDETVSQAIAAAARASIPLSKGKVKVEPIFSVIDKEKCIGCALCEEICAFNAIRLIQEDGKSKAETIKASCKGCGTCAASCPQNAISMQHFDNNQINAQIQAMG